VIRADFWAGGNVMESTADPVMHSNYPTRKGWLSWIGTGACSLGITLMIFILMNALLHPAPASLTLTSPPVQVNVIRIPRPDTPVVHKTPKPPAAEPEKPKPMPEAAHRKVPDSKLSLPFEINPKLPCGPATLEMPPVATAALSDFGLPNVFSAGDLDQPLITLTRIPPVYPLIAKQRNIQGWVTVRFMVTEEGGVENVTIYKAQPPGIFDQSVIRCVSCWRFRPGTVEGVPVKTRAETTVKFVLRQNG